MMPRWSNIKPIDEDERFAHLVQAVIASPPPLRIPVSQRIGPASVTWFETEPGVTFVQATGGSIDDRVLARGLISAQLHGLGYRIAQYSFDQEDPLDAFNEAVERAQNDPAEHGKREDAEEFNDAGDFRIGDRWYDGADGDPLPLREAAFKREATWDDIMEKAKRLIQTGNVQILRNGYNIIVGHVQGDHGDYQTEISRDDPNSRAITTWQCDCPWDQYAWQRTRQWKKYEGRPCAHILATYWKALSTPLDEDSSPANQSGGGQMNLFNMPQQAPPAGPTQMPGQPPMTNPGQMQIPLTPPVQAPPGPNVIPPFPMEGMDQAQMPNPVSVPGLKQPSPLNPVQLPGGTYSGVGDHWDFDDRVAADFNTQPTGFENANMVQLKDEDVGIAEGKSEAHGAGQWRTIPQNSIGEVMGQDPTTGWVEVIFPIHDAGPLEPYHTRAWFEPNKLTPRPDIQRPGPMIRRRR